MYKILKGQSEAVNLKGQSEERQYNMGQSEAVNPRKAGNTNVQDNKGAIRSRK